MHDLPLDADLGTIDLRAEVGGLGCYETLLGRSEAVELFGWPVRVLTLDALILAKHAVGRPQDHADVAGLEAIRALRKP